MTDSNHSATRPKPCQLQLILLTAGDDCPVCGWTAGSHPKYPATVKANLAKNAAAERNRERSTSQATCDRCGAAVRQAAPHAHLTLCARCGEKVRLQDLTEQVGDLLAARPAIAEHMELVEVWADEFTKTQSLMLEQLRVMMGKCDALELDVRTMREELGSDGGFGRCAKCGTQNVYACAKCGTRNVYTVGGHTVRKELSARESDDELGGGFGRCPKCGKVDAPATRPIGANAGIYCGGCGWATNEDLWREASS